MFSYLINKMDWDKDYPTRSQAIEAYTRVYNGNIYDHLPYHFFQERETGTKNYILLNKRRPSVRYNLCSLVVDNSVSLLFGSDHFPKIKTDDEAVDEFIEDIVKCYKLNKVMIHAATIGSTGSVAIFIKVIDGKLILQPKNTRFLTPIFDHRDPDKLIKIIERYKVIGQSLIDAGIPVEKKNSMYWFHREWDDKTETLFTPRLVTDKDEDVKNTPYDAWEHKLGFVPAVWIINIPKIIDSDESGAIVDGYCTFEKAVNTNIEIEYLLSQNGRALKYSADPLLVLNLQDEQLIFDQNSSSVTDMDGQTSRKMIKNCDTAIMLGEKDKASLLEISGSACAAVLEQVRTLRELALESIHGNRANADKVNAAQSGRAMQAMNQALIWLTDNLRPQYGDSGLLKILKMIVEATNSPGIFIKCGTKSYRKVNANAVMSLHWPQWYPDTPQDRVNNANALKLNKDAGNMSTETAVTNLSQNYGVEDVDKEIALIKIDQKELADLKPKVNKIIQA